MHRSLVGLCLVLFRVEYDARLQQFSLYWTEYSTVVVRSYSKRNTTQNFSANCNTFRTLTKIRLGSDLRQKTNRFQFHKNRRVKCPQKYFV